MTLLKQACKMLGVDETRVISHRIDDLEACLFLVVDNGIAGCPKYSVPLSDLGKQAEPVSIKDELSKKKVPELRKIAKASNIKGYSRMGKPELIKALNA